MRVLMLSWEYPPSSVGGIATHVDGLAGALARQSHDVTVLTRRVPGTEPDALVEGVRVIRADTDLPWLPDQPVGSRASASHALVAAAIDRLGEWRPDVVHAHDWEVAWAAEVCSHLYGAPIVTTLHGTERGRHGGHLPPGTPTDVNGVEWWLALRSRRIIATTGLMAREIIAGFEVNPSDVVTIPSGIDAAWWDAPDETSANGREQLVFAWGRIQYEKGFQVLARAVASLRHDHPDLACTIAGRGSYLPELQSQIDIAGVGDLVELPGYINDHELRAALHRAGCVVIPSLYEPFGVVAIEALAARAPLVVAETGALAELFAGTGAALTFEPGNAADLAGCITRVLDDPDVAAELTSRGTQLIDDHYSWKAIAARTLAVYRDAGGAATGAASLG